MGKAINEITCLLVYLIDIIYMLRLDDFNSYYCLEKCSTNLWFTIRIIKHCICSVNGMCRAHYVTYHCIQQRNQFSSLLPVLLQQKNNYCSYISVVPYCNNTLAPSIAWAYALLQTKNPGSAVALFFRFHH